MRRLFSAVFLVLLIAEWGTHTLTHVTASTAPDQTVSAVEDTHGGQTHSVMLCSDGWRRDQQLPGFSGETVSENVLDLIAKFKVVVISNDDRPVPFRPTHALNRPGSPPFHPPQTS